MLSRDEPHDGFGRRESGEDQDRHGSEDESGRPVTMGDPARQADEQKEYESDEEHVGEGGGVLGSGRRVVEPEALRGAVVDERVPQFDEAEVRKRSGYQGVMSARGTVQLFLRSR